MFIIIGIIIFAFFGLILGRWSETEDGALVGLLLGSLVGLLLAIVISAAAASVTGETETVVIKTIPIYAFQDNLNIKGHRTLVSGYIDEVLCYYYTYQTADGGYKIGHVEQDDATVYYATNEEDCRMEVRETHFKNSIHNWIAESFAENSITYAFYIPEGSITTEYNVDLQ